MKCPICRREIHFRLRLCVFHGDYVLSSRFIRETTLFQALTYNYLLDKNERPSVQGGSNV